MSILDDESEVLSRKNIIDLYISVQQWLEDHCGVDIMNYNGKDTFPSPLFKVHCAWSECDGISSKVHLVWNPSKNAYSIFADNPKYYIYVKDDVLPSFIDFSKCDIVFIGRDGSRIRKDPATGENIFESKHLSID